MTPSRRDDIGFRVLGPIEFVRGDRSISVGHPKQRCVLAVLLVEANRTVPTEQLIDRVWGDSPPARARNVLSGYLTRLRSAIDTAAGGPGEVTVSRRSGGYLLAVPPDRVDLHRFRALVALARDAEPARRSEQLTQALGLWRGPAFAGTGGDWLDGMRTALARERLAAGLAHADAARQLGQSARVVDELVVLAAEHPLDERVAAALMLTLWESGRPAQALSVYAAMRRRLAEELGVEPGGTLRLLHRQLLHREPEPAAVPASAPRAAAAAPPGAPIPPGVIPRQLPPAAAHFIGRTGQLRRLAEQLAAVGTGHPSTVAISLIHGSAGVGKTTLAVYWAHQAAPHFPDGQLHLNLRGFDQSQPPLQPTEALGALLRALNVSPQRIPATLDEQASLYRSVVAGRRLLIVLDNAATTGQVRPLLPGTRSCLVLVTSRNQLTGLAAGDGAGQLALDVLAESDAVALLRSIVGTPRLAAEPEAARALAELCARLPLALRIVANHLLAAPERTIADVLDELADRRYRLDALATDDESTTVRAVFSLSYHALKPEAARTFRLLGLHEGAQISEPAAAALTDLPVSQIRQLLGVLCRGHLLERVGAHRYQFHDLLRLYAAERAEAEESDDERRRIVRGMLRWYLRTASAADRILCPGRFRGPTEGLPAPVPAPDLAGHRQALAWCETENGNLVAALRQANTAGEHALAWQLAWAQWGFFDLRKPWAQWLTSYQIGLESARALGDRSAEALLLNGLGTAYYYPRRFRKALDCYQRAQSIWRDTGDLRGQASVAGNLGNLLLETRQLPAAVEQFQQALALHSGDDGHAAAITLGNLAEALCLLGRFGPALDHARRALALHRAAGSRRSEALILAQAGNALRGLGRAEEALAQYAGALRVSRLIGDRQAEGWACHFLAEALYAADRRIPAHRYWQRAIALFDALGDPQAGDIRVRLAALGAADHVSQQV